MVRLPDKQSIALLYGGRSAEHDVSLLSARNIYEAIDKSKFTTTLIYIDLQGKWHLQQSIEKTTKGTTLLFPMDRSSTLVPESLPTIHIDAVFPVLHGPHGEDGAIQGFLETLGIPYVGPDILSSAACMDKDIMKRLLREAGISVSPSITLTCQNHTSIDLKKVFQQLGKVLFVKPANMGSSVGVSRVESIKELGVAIDHAFLFDTKILIESEVKGQEIECAILGNQQPKASGLGSILPKRDNFYSYDAKYLDENGAELEIPAKLSPKDTAAAQEVALKAYKALGCQGMARVDMFLTPDHRIIVNELNTIPGFTSISMYPKLWEIDGLSYTNLITQLIKLGIERAKERQTLRTSR